MLLGLLLLSLFLLILMSIPFYYMFKGAYFATIVKFEPVPARACVALLAGLVLAQSTLAALALAGVPFASRHVHKTRVKAANTIHPTTT